MLLRFSAANHGSILEGQELSLIASSLKDGEAGLIDREIAPNTKVLSSAIIYGANASGKSNFISALRFMRQAVLLSQPKGAVKGAVPRDAFALGGGAAELPSVFDIDFIHDGVRYHFGFEATDESFSGEWLYAFPSGRRQMLYERTGEKEFKFGRGLKGRNRVIADLVRPNSLFISAAIQNGHEELTKISSFFSSIHFSSDIEVGGSAISTQFKDNGIDQRTIDLINKVGTGVVGFRRVEKEMNKQQLLISKEIDTFIQRLSPVLFGGTNSMEEAQEDKKKVVIELAHQGVDGVRVFFMPEKESAGTRRLLLLASAAFRALDEGSLLVVDELDASLHTQACEAFVSLFSNKAINSKGAQLVATTHDTNLMRSPMLRRDQIWFTEKDHRGATHVFPLSDIQTRRTDNIEKGYLEGRFGAIPFAGPVTTLFQSH
ncbi:AAA family ATPase [Microvirga soli]|uniref:AAA family ATPase n=1 Tax=Microvirga soli TaxID=1854496 RepID=UPI00191DD1ED|nr:ATP-binding protein [Microvirga soli]